MFEERIKCFFNTLSWFVGVKRNQTEETKTTRKVLDRFKKFSLFDQTLGVCSLQDSSLKKQHQAKLFVGCENISAHDRIFVDMRWS